MKKKEHTRTELILAISRIFALLAFCISIVIIFSFLMFYIPNYFKQESGDLSSVTGGLHLLALRGSNPGISILILILFTIVLLLKATVWWIAVRVITEIKIKNPFSTEVTRKLEYISYALITICLLSLIGYGTFFFLDVKPNDIEDWKIGSSFFMAAIVFIISQIFKRGVELQSENELTV